MKFCDRPFKYAYLTTEGRVWPCPWMHYDIGNLYEQDLDEIWHSEAAQAARATILDGSFAYCRKMSCRFCERDELEDLSEEEIAEKAVASEVPELMTIANDRICNIACTTCRKELYSPKEGERGKIDDALTRLIPFASRAKSVELNGNGEFLSNQSFIKFLKELHMEEKDSWILFETNGVLFDEAHWNQFSHLEKYNVGVTVTLNSLRKDIYRYLSGGFDHLEQVLDNLRFLSKLRRENKINHIILTMVVQESNFWEIPEFVQTFAESGEFEVDQVTFRPVYNWFGMDRETYWFKNILNPLHPYHKEYLKILDDKCWKNPKVYDWGCHNIREARQHPLSQEKIFNHLLLDIYDNKEGLSPVEYVKKCVERINGKRIGIYGENEFEGTLIRLLQVAGAEVTLRLTRFDDVDGDIPTVSMPNFRPESVDTILLMELHDQQNRINNLRSLKFNGSIYNLEEFIEGKNREDGCI